MIPGGDAGEANDGGGEFEGTEDNGGGERIGEVRLNSSLAGSKSHTSPLFNRL